MPNKKRHKVLCNITTPKYNSQTRPCLTKYISFYIYLYLSRVCVI